MKGENLCVIGRVLIKIEKRKVWKDRRETVEEFLVRASRQILILSQSSIVLLEERKNLYILKTILIRTKEKKIWKDRREKRRQWMPVNGVSI